MQKSQVPSQALSTIMSKFEKNSSCSLRVRCLLSKTECIFIIHLRTNQQSDIVIETWPGSQQVRMCPAIQCHVTFHPCP